MLTKEYFDKLRSRLNSDKHPATPLSSQTETEPKAADNNLGVDDSVLNKINPKWRKLLEANRDLDMSKYINANTKYDDFGVPIIDFDETQDDELPKISAFGITE